MQVHGFRCDLKAKSFPFHCTVSQSERPDKINDNAQARQALPGCIEILEVKTK